MEGLDTTLNTADAVANSSLADDKPAFDPDSTGIVNTVDDVDPSDKTLKQDADDNGDKGDADDQGETRFDKIPRFQELLRERDEARRNAEEARQEAQRIKEERIRIEAERDLLKGQKTEVLPYKDTSNLTADELAEWMSSDPKGYHDNLILQAKELAKREVQEMLLQSESQKQKAEKEEGIKRTYAVYEKENPDFKAMWDSGEILKYIQENPGHTPISAHQVMTMEKRMLEVKEKAAKEAEEKANKNWQAKRKASVLGGGPAKVSEPDADLQNTKARGGPVTVLAERLRQMRRAS